MSAVAPHVEKQIVARAQQTTGSTAELDALAAEYGLMFSELVGILARHRPATAIQALLDSARAHPGKRVQRAAEKVTADLDKLRALISEDEEKHAARRKAEEEKAAARAEVERLEKRLAAAKAKLRGEKRKPAAAQPDGPSAKEIRSWARNANVDCPATGRVPGAVRDAYLTAHPDNTQEQAS